jgi:hypothetical protein
MPMDIPASTDMATSALPSLVRRTVEISDEDENLIVAFIPSPVPKTSNP